MTKEGTRLDLGVLPVSPEEVVVVVVEVKASRGKENDRVNGLTEGVVVSKEDDDDEGVVAVGEPILVKKVDTWREGVVDAASKGAPLRRCCCCCACLLCDWVGAESIGEVGEEGE